MLKKIVLGTLLVGLIGILVVGGVIRTVDKTGNVAEARGLGQGRGYGSGDGQGFDEGVIDSGWNAVQGGNSRGQGGGQGQGAGNADRLYPNYQNAPEEWVTYEGVVVEPAVDGGELVIETSDGQEIVVGAGPGYMEAQGFALGAGEGVQVQGYYEDGELKAAQVTRLRDGQTITLRDQMGRPAWAGSGRRANEQAETNQQVVPGQGAGTGQAEVSEWLSVRGTVTSIDTAALVLQTADGAEFTLDGRPWRFAQEQGFWSEAGDELVLVGFDEEGDFEVGQIRNDTTGETLQIRDENGRPLWAGRGRRGG